MSKITKIFISALFILIFISSCNNKESSSPFDKILSKPPYAELTDSIKEEPKKDELYFQRAVLLNTNNFAAPALADFQKAWSLKKNEKYAFGISSLLLDKNPDSAILFLKQALKELPESFLLQFTLARAYNAQGKTEEALKICDAILQLNPQQVDVLKMKAELLDKKGNPAESISLLEKAYSLTPFDIDLNYELAYKYAENKNAKIINLCDSLIRIDTLKLHAEPYYYKGIYFSNISDKVTALSLFDQAILHDKYYMNAYIEKGRVLYDQEKFNAALKVFQLANTLSNSFPDAYFWMGKSLEALGQKMEANLNYLRAYGLDKTFIEAKEAADRLK